VASITSTLLHLTSLWLTLVWPTLLPTDQIDSWLETDWPTVRGQNWDGHSKESGISESWPKSGPPVLWTRELGGGYSSFVAWEHWVATQYQTLSGQYIVCMDAETGHTRWEVRYDWPYEPAGVYPGPRSTPVYSEGRIYFTSPAGLLRCLDAANGRSLWSAQLDTDFAAKLPGFGYACSPIVLENKVIVPVGGDGASIVAFEKSTGSVLWQSGKDAASYASIYPIRFQGEWLLIGYLQNALVWHDAGTGRILWRRALSTGYDEHSTWPVYQEPFLWISGPFQAGSEWLELRPDADDPIRMVRKSNLLSNDIFSSVLHDHALFGFDLHEAQAKTHRTSRGIFRCIDFLSGEALWSVGDGRLHRSSSNAPWSGESTRVEPLERDQIGHATVLVADNKLILFNDMGELILAHADRKGYRELGRARVLSGEICWTQPALSRGRLFIRNQSRAACVYLGKYEGLSIDSQRKVLTVDDIPQAKFRDLAQSLLGVEPEFLFDLPSLAAFTKWYLWSIGLLFLATVSHILVIGFFQESQNPERTGSKNTKAELLLFLVTLPLGLAGTTLISRWSGEFIFTWHLCLFAAWQFAIGFLELSPKKVNANVRLRSWFAAILFLSVCALYFLLCRRLSLVFQWAFLTGFVGALPVSIVAQLRNSSSSIERLWQSLSSLFAFTAFHWTAVAMLYLRYTN
jgi:outer membrane protein assembly factor BamB